MVTVSIVLTVIILSMVNTGNNMKIIKFVNNLDTWNIVILVFMLVGFGVFSALAGFGIQGIMPNAALILKILGTVYLATGAVITFSYSDKMFF